MAGYLIYLFYIKTTGRLVLNQCNMNAMFHNSTSIGSNALRKLQVISDAMRTPCFRYFRKNGSPSHNFSVVIFFQKFNPPDFEIYLQKLIKMFPIWCNINFGSVFFAFFLLLIAMKTHLKLTLHHMGKFFNS